MKIKVVFQDGSSEGYDLPECPSYVKSSLQRYKHSTRVMCELKRRVSASKGIDPLSFRLSFDNDSNKFDDMLEAAVFPRFVCTPRTRKPSENVELCTWSSKYDWKGFNLKLDPNDTLLDVKFLLAQRMHNRFPPESIQFVINYANRLLENDMTVKEAGFFSPSTKEINWWMELETTDNQGNFIVRTQPDMIGPRREIQSIGAYLRERFMMHKDKNHLGWRTFNADGTRGEYVYTTFAQMDERVTNIASGFRALGIPSGNQTRIGICANNRPEWVLSDYAGQTQGFVTVPLYDVLSSNAIEFIANHAEVSIAVCSLSTLEEVAKAKRKCPTLKYVILCDDDLPTQEWIKKNGKEKGGYTHTISEIEALGRANKGKYPDSYSGIDDLTVICYTSGTTGNPKGVMLTNRNMLTCVETLISAIGKYFDPSLRNVNMSYLPLAHIMEKMVELGLIGMGTACAYWSGDREMILEDIQAARPTFFPGAPRVYQKFQDKILAGVNDANFIRRWLFNKAYDAKETALKEGRPAPAWTDRLVFSKVKALFGGEIRDAVSGSAPLSISTANFIRVVFADGLAEGYGLTETNGMGTGSRKEDTGTYGHVGTVGPSIEMKLMDVPDMNYFVSDEPEPRGEIWFKGESVFQGYYKNPEKTAEVRTRDGWFASGDIGKWRLDGKLQIIDRVKNIFKLSQGEYIRPEYIENVYRGCKFVGNVFVDGRGTERYVVAIVFPDPEVAEPWAKQNGLGNLSWPDLVKSPQLKKAVMAEMEAMATREKLLSFEKARKIHLITDDFTTESGHLTATFKLKRGHCRQVFQPEIDAMYSEKIQSKL